MLLLGRSRCRLSVKVLYVVLARAFLAALVAGESRQDVTTGGLVSYPLVQIGPNLLLNSGFENSAPATGKPAQWSDSGFTADSSIARTGHASFRLTDPYQTPNTKSAYQDVPLKKGSYRIGAWVKTANLGNSKPAGVRICLAAPTSWPARFGGGCTAVIKGTHDWHYVETTRIVITQKTPARFSLSAYGAPDGTAWFDDVELRREEQPLDVFMLYPNYRGMLFDDQPQIARFAITIDLPPDARPEDFHLDGEVIDEASGKTVMKNAVAVEPNVLAQFDFSALELNRSYQVRFRLWSASTRASNYGYPAYRIVKVGSSARRSMTITFDEHNRFLLRGKPAFLLGVYDSGLGYTTTERGWLDLLTSHRRLFELPINLYLNYWYGVAPNASFEPMMDVLQQEGIYAITNANCFGAKTVRQVGKSWFLDNPDSVITRRSQHPGFAGFYAADECRADLVTDVFSHYQRMKALDPGGIVLGTLLPDAQLPLWRDSVDVLATDPYPLYGPEPAIGYPLSKVSDGARMTAEAVRNSRPFVTVLQFFQFTSKGRWPTANELRGMSYAAIVEGANGLFFWSLGANALAYVCNGSDADHSPSGSSSWCKAKIEHFQALETVMLELKSQEPMLTAKDAPDLLPASTNPQIRTRAKSTSGKAWLIAYNSAGVPQTTTFEWRHAPSAISIDCPQLQVSDSVASCRESFAPYEARTYSIATLSSR